MLTFRVVLKGNSAREHEEIAQDIAVYVNRKMSDVVVTYYADDLGVVFFMRLKRIPSPDIQFLMDNLSCLKKAYYRRVKPEDRRGDFRFLD